MSLLRFQFRNFSAISDHFISDFLGNDDAIEKFTKSFQLKFTKIFMTNAKTQNVSQLEDHVGYWLRTVSNQISGSFKKKLEAKKTTVAEWVVLRLLYDCGASPGSIAEKAGMTPGAITKIVDKLLAKVWVTRTESKNMIVDLSI